MTTRTEQRSAKANRDDYDQTLSAAGHRMQWRLGENSQRRGQAWFWAGICRNCGAEITVGATWTSSSGVRDARKVPCSGPGTDVLTAIETERAGELVGTAITEFVEAVNANRWRHEIPPTSQYGDHVVRVQTHLNMAAVDVHFQTAQDAADAVVAYEERGFTVEPTPPTSEDSPRDAGHQSYERNSMSIDEASATVGEATDLPSAIKHVKDVQSVLSKLAPTGLEQFGASLQAANVGGPIHTHISSASDQILGAVNDLQQVEKLLQEREGVADLMTTIEGPTGSEPWLTGGAKSD